MVIALIGFPFAGKTTYSLNLKKYFADRNSSVHIVKLSKIIKLFLNTSKDKISREELEETYYRVLKQNGEKYWAEKILELNNQYDILIIDGVWYENEIKILSEVLKNRFLVINISAEKSILYERACDDTIKKGEDIFELKRVMDIIKTFDVKKFDKYVNLWINTDENSFADIDRILVDYKL